jgi:glycerophosphoryl diester phosphodiesterase
LDELLAWARRRKTRFGKPLGIVIEIKNDPVRYRGIERKVLASVRKAGMQDRVVVISFDHAAVRRFRRLKPSIPVGLLYSEPLPRAVERAVRAQADALMPRRTLVTRGLVEQARKSGLKVATWTVNETPDMKRVLGCGVHAVTTNFPDRIKPLLGGKS